MKLKFNEKRIYEIAQKYDDASDASLKELQPTVCSQGFITKEQLKTIVKWKSPRSVWHIDKNEESEGYVKTITSFALSTKNERARIEVLTILNGVSWPIASVILHWFHKEPYPILDFRALWSCSTDVPNQYNFSFWKNYVEFCRSIIKRNDINMRTLDRALWQYSKDNQKA